MHAGTNNYTHAKIQKRIVALEKSTFIQPPILKRKIGPDKVILQQNGSSTLFCTRVRRHMRALIIRHPLAGCTHDTDLMQRQWLQVRSIAGVRVGALSCDTRSRMHRITPGNVARVRSSPNPNKWTDQSQDIGTDANEKAQLAVAPKKVCQFAPVKLYTCVPQEVYKCATRRSPVYEGEWQIHLSKTLPCDLPLLCIPQR